MDSVAPPAGSEPSPAPSVSVVVLTCNRPWSLWRCLRSLTEQQWPRGSFEVVLVDVSREPVDAVVEEFSDRIRIRHVVAPNRGVACNRNRGVREARSARIAVVDDDCTADRRWLTCLVDVLDAHPGALVGGAVQNARPDNACATAGQVISEAVDRFHNPPGVEARFFPGLNSAFERERYLEIGGCDSGFGRLAAEDRDFAERWRLAGGTLRSCPEAVVWHEHRTDLRGFVRQYFNYGRGAWRYHSLSRARRTGGPMQSAGLHVRLTRYLHGSLEGLPVWMRWKVFFLLGVWQVANLTGYACQALVDARPASPEGSETVR